MFLNPRLCMAATVWCTVSERPGCSLQVSRCSMFHVVPHLSGISSHAWNKGITRPTSLQKKQHHFKTKYDKRNVNSRVCERMQALKPVQDCELFEWT